LSFDSSYSDLDVDVLFRVLLQPPDVGVGSSRHPPHQDLWYFPFRPAHQIVASWTAMQKIDKQNGCLFVKPGTHKGELIKHTYPNDGVVNKAYHGIHNMTEKDGDAMLHVEMEPGDTLFFHPILIHGSGRNLSDRYRKAISCHYASTHCTYAELTGSIQEDIAQEIEAMASRKGVKISFNDLWRFKSRLIQGKEDTL
jgi:phytanoyl-CoA hydroxylase